MVKQSTHLSQRFRTSLRMLVLLLQCHNYVILTMESIHASMCLYQVSLLTKTFYKYFRLMYLRKHVVMEGTLYHQQSKTINVQGERSHCKKTVLSGVQQGSVLCPLLFIFYMATIYRVTSHFQIMFISYSI